MITFMILHSPKRRKKTSHRIMVGMGIADILASIWYFASTWVIPAGTLSGFGDGTTETVFWASGDQNGIACNISGFFNQFAACNPLYSAMLALYYLLVVKYGWSTDRLAAIEWRFHVLPWGYAFISALFAAITGLYGPVEWTCWINPDVAPEDRTLIQNLFVQLQWLLFGPIWAAIVFSAFVFIALYRKMKLLEKRVNSYASSILKFEGEESPEPDIEKCELKPSIENRKNGSVLFASISKDDEGDNNGRLEENLESGCNEGGNNISREKRENNSNGNKEKNDKEEKSKEMTFTVSLTSDVPKKHGRKPNKIRALFGPTLVRNHDKVKSSDEVKQDDKKILKDLKKKIRHTTKSRMIALQGLRFVAAFYVTWLFSTISRIFNIIDITIPFPIQFLDTTFVPLQGFLNFLIYIRPLLEDYRHKNPKVGFWMAFRNITFDTS